MIRIRPEDKWFSLYIRARDRWTCQRCGTRYIPPTKALHNAHCFGRGSHMTRWDEDNCMALCYGCHSYLDSHPVEKIKFWVNKKGQKAVDSLEVLSNTQYYGWKRDAKEIAKFYKNKFKEENERIETKSK